MTGSVNLATMGLRVGLLVLALLLASPAHAQDFKVPRLENEATAAAYEKGRKLAAAGRLEAAIEQFDEAVRRSPDFYLAHYAAGNALAGMNRLREAEGRFRDAVAIRPKFANGWNAIGAVLLARRDHAEALKAFDRALRIDANYHLARFHRGKTLLELGRAKEAEGELRKVLVTKPEDHDTRVALAAALATQSNPKGALEELDRVLAADKNHAGALLVRAGVLLSQGKSF